MNKTSQNNIDEQQKSNIWNSPWIYLVLTLSFSYFFWIWAALTGQTFFEDLYVTILVALGGLSPMIVGITLFYKNNKKKERRKEFWVRIVDVKRINMKWYAIIIGINFATVLIAVLIVYFLFGTTEYFSNFMSFYSDPLEVFNFFYFQLLIITMEEIGWRGYAIECLQRRYSALKSSLILGIVWALWHIPLYFISGLLIEEKGLFTLWFWVASFSIIPQTILITWIYNNNEQSVFGVILFHFLMNLLGESFFLDGLVKIIREAMWLVFTIIVINVYGPESLVRNDKSL